MKVKSQVTLIISVFLICFLSGGALSLWAQSATTGALSGSVTDASGAVIPNVTVTLVSDATGQTQLAMTGTNGDYVFGELTSGTYTVKFSAQGFKTAQMLSVVVNVSQAYILDAKLETGETAEPVTCQCTVREAASSSTGTLMNSKAITSVPLTTRNFTQVLSMGSGSAASVNNAGTLGGGTQTVNVNGNTATGIFTINGSQSGYDGVPNPDTITAFKIDTSQYDAGYGAMVPSTNVITKGGTNEFHGDLWEFNRNDIFNANDFFQNAAGQKKPNLKQNQFGGTLGGPIKKDRVFFFGSYQGTRQVNGLDATSLSAMFLPPLTNDRSRATIGAEFCPATHGATYNTYAGGTQVACDGSNINPAALNLLNAKLPDGSGYFIPTPQKILSNGLGFSSYSVPSTYNENQYTANGDYVISKKHTISARLFFSRELLFRTFGATVTSGNPFTPGGPQRVKNNNNITSLWLTSAFTSNVVNQVRMNFSHSNSFAYGPGISTATSVGMTPVDPFFDEIPMITINGSLGAFRSFGNVNNDFSGIVNTYQWSDNLSWIHGNQTIRTGVFVFKQLWDRMDTGPARGQITFQNFTDFLIGLDAGSNGSPNGFSNVRSVIAADGIGPRGEIRFPNRWYVGSAFLEDDVKVTPRFTLNLGVRWEYISPTLEFAGKVGNVFPSLLNLMPIPPLSGTYIGDTVAANYNPNLINPYTGKPIGPPPAGVVVRGSKTPYQNNTPLDAFAPRFGFAWQPGSKQGRLSMRGGYGWFYQTPPPGGGNAPNTPYFTTQPFGQGFNNSDSANNASTLQKPFPTTTLGFQLRTPTSRLADRIAGPEYRLQLVQQWNLNTQFSLSPTLSLDVGYVGSYGNHLVLQQVLNQPLLASSTNPVNCGYDGVPTDCITTNTAQNAALRVPIMGELPTALGDSAYIGNSWYHGMQATLREQVSRGLMFSVSYTYSKSMNNTTLDNDQTNLALDWARSSFDRTHRVFANFNYQLPDATRQGMLGNMMRGWSLAGMVIIQSGSPMTLTDSNGGTVYGSAAPSTVMLCPGATNASLATSGRDQSRLNGWFNTSAVCPAHVIGSDGSTGYGNSGQDIVNGPGQFNTDVSFGKETKVGGLREDAVLVFRAEFYNAFNHPQFSNPGTVFGTASFGKITQASVAPRLIQFGLKYLF